ncbi:hypothetical protein [Pantoea sp. 18069]|uniref:hypothetical protein n=1 Tax=Pantoea sp. 18069 TaxID=2681415 RepID=UPI00135B9539|nr:hypothetical protein [Pantoea sp. 18069]
MMNKQEFFLSIEPSADEIAAAEAEVKNHGRAPMRGAPKGAALARGHKLFQARAYRLWLEYSNPEQLVREDMASALIEKGGSEWVSEDGSQRRVYFNGLTLSRSESLSCYFDVNVGSWHAERGALLTADKLAAVTALVGF